MAENDAIGIGVMLVIYGGLFLIALGVQLLVCFVLYNAAKGVPESFRGDVSPGLAFLLVVPVFNLIWQFIYPRKLSQAYQRAFRHHNALLDDCGEQLALYWAVCVLCTLIPCLGGFSAIAAFVLMIIYLIKITECKSRVGALLQGSHGAGPIQGPSDDNPYHPTASQ